MGGVAESKYAVVVSYANPPGEYAASCPSNPVEASSGCGGNLCYVALRQDGALPEVLKLGNGEKSGTCENRPLHKGDSDGKPLTVFAVIKTADGDIRRLVVVSEPSSTGNSGVIIGIVIAVIVVVVIIVCVICYLNRKKGGAVPVPTTDPEEPPVDPLE